MPVFVNVAPLVLSLTIWMTGLSLEPSAETVPELVTETVPVTLPAAPFPVPVEIATPAATVIVPLLVIVTLPPPCAWALTPNNVATIAEGVSNVAVTFPMPKLKRLTP